MTHSTERKEDLKRLSVRLCAVTAILVLLSSLVPAALAEETLPPETSPEETVSQETAPEETVPEETVPEETVPEETVPEETVPEETVPEETVPEETVPEEIRSITFYYPDRTESVPVDMGKSFSGMYPGIDPASVTAEKADHTFLGWFESADGGQTLSDRPFDFTEPVTADLALYPGFRLNSYTVTYMAEGAVLATVTVDHGANAQPPEMPQKEGFFAAWDHDGRNITADTLITLIYTREGSGVFVDVTGEDNFGGGWLSESEDSLAQAIPLTEQERLMLEAGTDVSVWLALRDHTASVSPGDSALVEGMRGDMALGVILEASLFKQVGEEAAETLDVLSGSVTVSFLVPQELRPQEGAVRAFAVIRVHNGVAEAVDTAYNGKTGVLSFSSDRPGVFALVYTDTREAPPAFTPDTADPFRPVLWTACLLTSALSVFGLLWRKKQRLL